jgi:hypothetical protein
MLVYIFVLSSEVFWTQETLSLNEILKPYKLKLKLYMPFSLGDLGNRIWKMVKDRSFSCYEMPPCSLYMPTAFLEQT